MATVESLVQRVDTLESQLTQANQGLASAGISVVNSAPSVSVEQLQASGIAPATAATIVNVHEQTNTELLALRDTASRNGWPMFDYYNERTALLTTENTLRKMIGDDEYLTYLQHTGQSWQVIIQTVFSNSAAEGAGLEAGDVIHRYDGQRVFSSAGLQLLSSQGTKGDLVDITV